MSINKIIALMIAISIISFASGYLTRYKMTTNMYSIISTDIGDFIIRDHGLYRLSKLQSEGAPIQTAYKKDSYGYTK